MVAIIVRFYDAKDKALRNLKRNESIIYSEPTLFQKEGYLIVKNSILEKCGWDMHRLSPNSG